MFNNKLTLFRCAKNQHNLNQPLVRVVDHNPKILRIFLMDDRDIEALAKTCKDLYTKCYEELFYRKLEYLHYSLTSLKPPISPVIIDDTSPLSKANMLYIAANIGEIIDLFSTFKVQYCKIKDSTEGVDCSLRSIIAFVFENRFFYCDQKEHKIAALNRLLVKLYSCDNTDLEMTKVVLNECGLTDAGKILAIHKLITGLKVPHLQNQEEAPSSFGDCVLQ